MQVANGEAQRMHVLMKLRGGLGQARVLVIQLLLEQTQALLKPMVVLRRDEQEAQVLRLSPTVLRGAGARLVQGPAGIAVPDGEVVGAVADSVNDDGVAH